MTLFEYVTVAVSIVLSLGVVRLLDALRFAAARERRYWVHLLWILTKLMNHALFWWTLWGLREAAVWNFASFAWILLFPGTLYLQCTALVTAQPAAVVSWREHFYGIRRWFFGINLALLAHIALSGVFVAGTPLLAVSWLPLLVLAALNILGILSASPRLHAVIAVTALATNVLGFGAVWFQPG